MAPAVVAVICLLLFAVPVQGLSLGLGDLVVTDQSRQAVFLVDLVTGDRTVVSGCADASCSSVVGSGAGLVSPTGMTRDHAGTLNGALFVTDTLADTLFRIDPTTGDRTVVSGSGVGAGMTFQSPFSAALTPGGSSLYVVDESRSALFLVDQVSGDRTVVSGCADALCNTLVGTGTALISPHDIVLDPGSNSAFLLDTGLEAVFSVDLVSGDRTLISSSSQGSGFDFINPQGIHLTGSGDVIVSDSNTTPAAPGRVYHVDPVTGDRTVISSSAVGSGNDLQVPVGIAIDGSGNIVLLDFGPGVVVSVDPATGDRTVISSSLQGSGFTLESPVFVVLVPEPSTLLLLALGCAVLTRRSGRGAGRV